MEKLKEKVSEHFNFNTLLIGCVAFLLVRIMTQFDGVVTKQNSMEVDLGVVKMQVMMIQANQNKAAK